MGACRIGGVDRRTGDKWRNVRFGERNRKPVPPIHVVVVPASGPSRYLCEDERIHIADQLQAKATARAIAAELGPSPSSVSREIRRNRHPGSGAYRPLPAQARAGSPSAPAQAPHGPAPPRTAGCRPDNAGREVEPGADLPRSTDSSPTGRRCTWVHETVYRARYVQGRGQLRQELPTPCAVAGPGVDPSSRPTAVSPASPRRWW